jgi:signal transduction histidine kinase
LLVLLALTSVGWLRELANPATPLLVDLIMGSGLVLLAVLYSLNRRGAVIGATWGLLALLVLAINGLALADGPPVLAVVDPLFLVIPIGLAGVLLPLRTVPVLVLGAILDTGWLYTTGSPGLTPLRTSVDQLTYHLFNAAALFIATGGFAWLGSHRISNALLVQRGLYNALQLKEAQRTQLLAQVLSAQEEERRRLARELHDRVVQDLTVQIQDLRCCRQAIAAGHTSAAITLLDQILIQERQIVDTLRTLMQDLRPGVLDICGLAGAVEDLAERLAAETGLAIDCQLPRFPPLPPTMEIGLFRLAQEALTNIRKHAQARHVWVCLTSSDEAIEFAVRDDGRGFAVADVQYTAVATGHFGLAGMQERAAILGGHLTISSSPAAGTTVQCRIPGPFAQPPSDFTSNLIRSASGVAEHECRDRLLAASPKAITQGDSDAAD